ncbi:MAG: transglutaminase-like domain-containing protein [Bacteroidia bacterium]|nr:transglutaminase-like domain-containing protein [Bacteroidia bacterium]
MKNLFLLALTSLLTASCSESENGPFRYSSDYIDILKETAPYTDENADLHFSYQLDSPDADAVYSFFRLDTIVDNSLSTWENALRIGQFVTDNIPHNNQSAGIASLDAISLWNYHLNVENGFNCRWHSILTHELLLAAGIKNRFITCMPYKNDNECHVVNLVWLPELNKWAILDTDMNEYMTDDLGNLLSLSELRNCIINDIHYNIHQLTTSSPIDIDYLKSYWPKNIYWFSSHEVAGFKREPGLKSGDRYINLIPDGYSPYDVNLQIEILTSNDSAFWAIPE